MTKLEKPWQDYPPINGFSGKNLEELRQNIENYLETIIDIINEPIIDCEYCNGRGVKLEKIELP